MLDRGGFPAGDLMPAWLVWAAGAGLIFAGINILGQGKGSTDYGFVVGLATIGAGATALAVATLRGAGFLKRRSRA